MGFGKALHLMYRCYEDKDNVNRLFERHLRDCAVSDSNRATPPNDGDHRVRDCCFLYNTRKNLSMWLKGCMANEQHRVYLKSTYPLDFIGWLTRNG